METEIDFSKIKVKIEPLDDNKPSKSSISSVVDNQENKTSLEVEEKKSIEPDKSSNEILAELFQVFNATPPETILNDEYLLKKRKKKHKHKHEKHKKKIKKERRSKSNESEHKNNNKHKHKKKKKLEKRTENNKSDFSISDEEKCLTVNTENKIIDKTKNTSNDNLVKENNKKKIIISDLKNSNIIKDIEKKNKQNNQTEFKISQNFKSDSSELSLSDEETYLKEKSYYESSNSIDIQKNDRRHCSRNRNNYKKSWRSRSRSYNRRRSRSRSRSNYSGSLAIDKKRLLEIARKNAISMFKKGSLPGTQCMSQDIKDKVLMKMRYGGKTVQDLTEFCKKLSQRDSLNDLSSLSSNEDSDYDKSGKEKPFYHPFVLKDRGPIVMNIKNATQIPPKTADQTKAISMQFPVSSGLQHRESEWRPVPSETQTLTQLPISTKVHLPKNVFEIPLPQVDTQLPAFVSNSLHQESTIDVLQEKSQNESICPVENVNNLPIPVSLGNTCIEPVEKFDVSSIITKRLNAMRKLQENPNDPDAIQMMCSSQLDMSKWAISKNIPGQFTGNIDVNILNARELAAGQPCWPKKDQLTSTVPITSGRGMHLLLKMGWQPGEGLGKTKTGSLQPLLLDVKLDKRGLITNEDINKRSRKKKNQLQQAQLILPLSAIQDKHPVSLLGELAAKNKWLPPFYTLVEETGPMHQQNFIYQVSLNNIIYTPSVTSTTKKAAKALAAKYCLQQLGVLPT